MTRDRWLCKQLETLLRQRIVQRIRVVHDDDNLVASDSNILAAPWIGSGLTGFREHQPWITKSLLWWAPGTAEREEGLYFVSPRDGAAPLDNFSSAMPSHLAETESLFCSRARSFGFPRRHPLSDAALTTKLRSSTVSMSVPPWTCSISLPFVWARQNPQSFPKKDWRSASHMASSFWTGSAFSHCVAPLRD